ncbi:MAG: hypothetical protein WBN22_08730, partial [Verrucomicrobiia bacterium]
PQQSFPVLLNWWSAQNVKHRHLWPSLNAVNVGAKWKPEEIARQIQVVRNQPGASGEIIYHLRNLLENRALADVLRVQYSQPALVPASPWLDSIPPDQPKLTVTIENSGARAHWEIAGGKPAWLWILQFRSNGAWTTEILPANQTTQTFFGSQPDVIAVSAVDRVENEGEPAALKKGTPPTVRQSGKGASLDWRRNSNH